MTRNCRTLKIVYLASVWVVSTKVTIADGAAATSVIPSSGDAVKAGDIIFFRSDAPIFTEVFPASGKSAAAEGAAKTNTFCAPAFSRFDVETVTAAATNAAGGANAGQQASAADTALVIGSFPSKSSGLHHQALPADMTNKAGGLASCKSGAARVNYDTPYEFTSGDFSKVQSQRMGFTWGGLIVPYKFYLSDRSFKSNSSAVGFVGYEGYFPGVSLAGILALGPGTASTSQTTAASGSTPASATSTNSLTYTAAAGFVATFGGSIKAGVVFGRDWEGTGSGFKYENKTWMALSVGAGF
jgi:hypothetical protein